MLIGPTAVEAKSVLVVDDTAFSRRLTRAALVELGLEVVEAENGAVALQQMALTRFAAVVTDVNMPVLNGIELVRAMRANALLAPTPVLVLTAEAATESITLARSLGVAGWAVKPISARTLQAAVRKLVGLASPGDSVP